MTRRYIYNEPTTEYSIDDTDGSENLQYQTSRFKKILELIPEAIRSSLCFCDVAAIGPRQKALLLLATRSPLACEEYAQKIHWLSYSKKMSVLDHPHFQYGILYKDLLTALDAGFDRIPDMQSVFTKLQSDTLIKEISRTSPVIPQDWSVMIKEFGWKPERALSERSKLEECLDAYHDLLAGMAYKLHSATGAPLTATLSSPVVAWRRQNGKWYPLFQGAVFLGFSETPKEDDLSKTLQGFRTMLLESISPVLLYENSFDYGEEKGKWNVVRAFSHQIREIAAGFGAGWLVSQEKWRSVANLNEADKNKAKIAPAPELFEKLRVTLSLWAQSRRWKDSFEFEQQKPISLKELLRIAMKFARDIRFVADWRNVDFSADLSIVKKVREDHDRLPEFPEPEYAANLPELPFFNTERESEICIALQLFVAIFDNYLGRGDDTRPIRVCWEIKNEFVDIQFANVKQLNAPDFDSTFVAGMRGKDVIMFFADQLGADVNWPEENDSNPDFVLSLSIPLTEIWQPASVSSLHIAVNATVPASSTSIPVRIYVFEDRYLANQEKLKALLQEHGLSFPYTRLVTDSLKLQFDWDDEWNNLGPSSDLRSNNMGLLVNATSIHHVITTVKAGTIENSIVFCDMQFLEAIGSQSQLSLPSCALTTEFSSLLDELYRVSNPRKAPPSDDIERFAWLSDQRQGLMIVLYLLNNPKLTNVDIWLASDELETKPIALVLNKVAESKKRGLRVLDAEGSFSKVGAERSCARLRQALDEFAKKWEDVEQRVWPNSNLDWFQDKKDARVPHVYANISNREEYQRAIRNYLYHLTGRTDNKCDLGLHESLKHLLGECAIAHNSVGRHPTLGTVALMLAAAEKDSNLLPLEKDWFSDLDHSVWSQEIVPISFDLEATRKAVLSLHSLFILLLKPKEEGSYSNLVDARQETDHGGTHRFWIDFDFESVIPRRDRRFSLVEKLQNRPWMNHLHSGNLMPAYWNCRDALIQSAPNAKLAMTVFPIEVSCVSDDNECQVRRLTRFEFCVHE